MAKFRDSSLQETISVAPPFPQRAAAEVLRSAANGPEVRDRSIGSIIAETRNLSAEEVERILAYQRERGVRFGEAAIALGYASADDVLAALAEQFHYPYAVGERRQQNPELVVLNQPFSAQAEVFRAIRSQVNSRIFVEGERRRALAITSPDPGDGKSYFAANLALAFAQLGGRTLLVDADLRGPRQHEIFGLPNVSGLSGILSGRAEHQVIQQVTDVPSLFVLPVGITPPNPLELLERPAFGLLMRELAAKFDHVVVDTPAMQYGSDGYVIAARCGASLIVARKNRSRMDALGAIADGITQTSATLLGVVFNEH